MKNAYSNYTIKSKKTPQTSPIPNRENEMTKNNAGGYSFILDEMAQLTRFLILGTNEPTYYCSEREMTEANAQNVISLIKSNGEAVVKRIVDISDSGRAPKNDPALFALALAMTYGDRATKTAAYNAVSSVARTGTHLFHLAAYVNDMRSWGRGVRKAFGNWYNDKPAIKLAMQLVKYANRDGWTHCDILRLAHVKPHTPSHDALFNYAVGKAKEIHDIDDDVVEFMSAVDELKHTTNISEACKLISKFNLPREVVPTEMLNEKAIWETLLPHMGLTALIRNLATMTRIGLIAPFSSFNKEIAAKITDGENLHKSRVHPIQVLSALATYKAGHGARGNHSWNPDRAIVDALDDAFYAAFGNVSPTNKNIILALDISGSMTVGEIAGVPGLTPRMASAAMAMITAKVESNYEIVGFHNSLIRLTISSHQRLDDVINYIDRLGFGGTDCALPAIWAKANKIDTHGICIYTDNETWAGHNHPAQALADLRKTLGHDVRQVVIGMTATNFSVADPKDTSSIDVVGFDTAAPQLISDFISGQI